MYTITFTDGEIFIGGGPENSLWNSMPNKSIKSIRYTIPLHYIFQLTDYEAYNHIVEHTLDINNSRNMITKLIVMGKSQNKVTKVVFDFKFRKLFVQTSTFGEEYQNKPTSGWKVGLENGQPSYIRLK